MTFQSKILTFRGGGGDEKRSGFYGREDRNVIRQLFPACMVLFIERDEVLAEIVDGRRE